MDLKDYIITINELKYCKDSIRGQLLLVDSIESISGLPSNGKDHTLYILNDGVIYHYSSFTFTQVELEKQEIVEEKSVPEEVQEVEKSQLNKKNKF